jgi:tellurite resistance protein
MAAHHDALIYTMVLVSAADREMTDAELRTIGEIVRFLPVFRGFDDKSIPQVAGACAGMLSDEDGLEQAFAFIRDNLPERLRETAYAIACDIAAADGRELRLLELLRHALNLDRLIAAGIERGARARHMTG